MTNIDQLFTACKAFRDAIISLDRAELPISFYLFPKGSCRDTSYMLGAYLEYLGYGTYEYVCGLKGVQSHAWLEKDGLIVDITSDQFQGGVPVYVGPMDSLHKAFRVDCRHSYKASLDGGTIETDRFAKSYIAICSRIVN